jgi:hypothetical protein
MTEEILQFHYKEPLAILLLVYSADEANTLHKDTKLAACATSFYCVFSME